MCLRRGLNREARMAMELKKLDFDQSPRHDGAPCTSDMFVCGSRAPAYKFVSQT